MLRTVAVVGGGPAGLMAAEVLASDGEVSVTVYDRMPSVGRKLQLAGRGGLNLTHTEPLETFLGRYGESRSHLESAIRAFDPTALRAWSTGLGQRAVVGTSGRVFPEAFRATPLLRAWIARLESTGVAFRPRHTWEGWTSDGHLGFSTPTGDVTAAVDATVLALGGASWPRTGSNGAWVEPLESAGIDVAPLRPANGGFTAAWSDSFRQRFAGTPLKTVGLAHGGATSRGDVMITSTGIEGGAIYALGPVVRRNLDANGRATLHVDLRPDVARDDLAERIRRRNRPKDSMSATLRRTIGLPPIAIALLREAVPHLPINPDELAGHVKDFRVTLTGTQPIDRAISSAGGVDFGGVDGAFMLVRRPGTFVAGEMLDWEAPTGGYLLQATFATGVAAAEGVRAWLRR